MSSPAQRKKMSLAQLQEVIEKQSMAIKQLKEDAANKDNVIKSLEKKLIHWKAKCAKVILYF